MFHRYVDHNGQRIDYDRASWLMSRWVFSKALAALPETAGPTHFDYAIAIRMGSVPPQKPSPEHELQTLWNLYCKFHEEEFGKPFNPDVM